MEKIRHTAHSQRWKTKLKFQHVKNHTGSVQMSHEVLQSWLIILSFMDEGEGEGGFKREGVINTPVTFFI